MFPKLSIQEWVIYVILVYNTYVITILPGSSQLFDGIYYAQLGLFFIFAFIALDFDSLLKYKAPFYLFRYKILLLLLIIFLFSVFFVSHANNNDFKSILKLLTYLVGFYVFFLYVPKAMLADGSKFEFLFNLFIIFAIINSIAGLILLYTGITPNPLYSGYLTGLFGHPNTAGFIYSISIPLLLHKLFAKKIHFWLFVILVSFLSFCLLMTFSRSAYIATIISVLLIILPKSKKILLVSLGILSVAVVFFVSDFFISKGGMSSFSRLLLFFTAYDMITSNPASFLWGYGVFRSLDIFSVEKLFFGSLEIVVDPHNFVLLMGIQFGMVVTTSFIAFFIWVIIASRINRKFKSEETKMFMILSSSVCVGLIIQNLFEDIMVYPEYFVFDFFLIFLGYLFANIENRDNEKRYI